MSGALTAAGMGAVKTLLALLEPSTPPAVRLGAARALVDMGHCIATVIFPHPH
jgi:hypothetical protein